MAASKPRNTTNRLQQNIDRLRHTQKVCAVEGVERAIATSDNSEMIARIAFAAESIADSLNPKFVADVVEDLARRGTLKQVFEELFWAKAEVEEALSAK